MEQLTRSRTVMVLAVAGALLFMLGDVLSVVAYAILSPGHLGTFSGLGHAADWLRFSGALIVLVGVLAAGWELVLASRLAGALEVSAAAVGTLLITVGALVAAASPRSQTAADVVTAVGVAIWAFLVLSRAARTSISEQHLEPGRPAQAPVWLGAAAGLLILAVGSGLPTSVDNRGLSVASGALMAVGIGIFAGALVVARSDRLLRSRPVPAVLAGLGVLTVAFLADAIVAGVVFGPNGTLTGLRVGVSLATAIEAAGVGVLGLAAWLRVAELTGSAPRGPLAPPPPPARGPGDPTLALGTDPARPSGEPRACPFCGAGTGPEARFCARCGRPLG